MNLIRRVVLLAFGLALSGCGGGGGGGGAGSVVLTGVVRWLPSAGAPQPSATVQVDSTTVSTNAGDGSFQLTAPSGASSLLVVHQPPSGSAVSFRFDFPPAMLATTDVGDLWIGPAKVHLAGQTLSAADDSPIEGATIEFAGKRTTTGADGRFTLVDVAYDEASLATFTSINGRASRAGFVTRTFAPVTGAVGGVVTIDPLYLPPDTGGTPPASPFNLVGTISPAAQAPGTVVTLWRGGAPIRQITVGSDRQYGFWVTSGSYQVRFANPGNGLGADPVDVTINDPSQVVRRDVTLR